MESNTIITTHINVLNETFISYFGLLVSLLMKNNGVLLAK
jgi:hypothetical protein